MQLLRRSPLKKIFSYVDSEADKLFTFLISIATAYYVSSFIKLKAANPFDISNITNMSEQWNPEGNYLKIILVVILSVVIFWLINQARVRFSQKWFRLFIALFATSVIAFSTIVPTATTPALDSFHSGEQLAPSLAYSNGKHLFTDIFFLHGAGADVLIPNISFALFNHGVPSIGSYVLIGALLQLLSTFIFFVVLARFIKSPGYYLFTVFYFLSTIYSGFSYEKNIPLYIVLTLTWYLLNRIITGNYQTTTLAVIGLVSSLSILWSYDIGVILISTSVLLTGFYLFFGEKKLLDYTLQKPTLSLLYLRPSIAVVGGGLLGQLIILVSLGFSGYAKFVQTFFDITKYQGLMFDYPVQPIDTNSFLFWLPIVLFCVTIYMLAILVIAQFKNRRTFSAELLLAVVLTLVSVIYIRFGVGRPDVGHIAMASPMLLLTSFYVIGIYSRYQLLQKNYHYWPVVIIAMLLFWPQLSINPLKLFSANHVTIGKIKEFLELPKKTDDSWLNEEQLNVTKYIRANSTKNDSLFVLVPEPLYYYTTNRQNPSRFAITWFADPKPYTEELLHSLKQKSPKFIIYDSLTSPYRIGDSIPIADRVPEVDDWIKAKYTNKIIIDKTTILFK